MHRSDDQFPFRKASRLVNEAQGSLNTTAFALTGFDMDRQVLLWAIYRQSLRPKSPSLISMFALANSIQRPAETIRRQFGILAEQGFCQRDGRQMHISEDFLQQPRILNAGSAVASVCNQLIVSMRAMGFTMPSGLHAQKREALVGAMLDIFLSAVEYSEALVHGLPARNLTTLYVVGIVAVHNAAPLTHDPVLGECYGYDHTVPPDELRRPISVSAIAAVDGIPYATVWRHVEAAERAGILRRTDSGYLLSDFYMASPDVSRATRVRIRYVRRVLLNLAAGKEYRMLPIGSTSG